MNLRVDHVRLPDGHELEEYHVLEYPDWVCVVCLTEDNRLVLVEQYRYGIDDQTMEFPGGAIDVGEDPEEAARRELLEETGYLADRWSFIGKSAPDPTRHTNWAWFYFASGARKIADQNLDPGENMSVSLMPVVDVLKAAEDGRLTHGIHLAALFWADRKGLLAPTRAT
ncbi:NUDIX hydrolase [Bacteroidota bacterium]